MQKIPTNFMQQVASDDIFVFAVGFLIVQTRNFALADIFLHLCKCTHNIGNMLFYNIKASLLSAAPAAAPAVALTWPLGEDELRTAELR